MQQRNILPSTNLTTNKSNTKRQTSLKPLLSTLVNKVIHNAIGIINVYSQHLLK